MARKKAGYHHGDLKNALVAAAWRTIEKRGPTALTLRGAATAAGVSVAAPYRHFADKEALLAAVITRGFHELTAALELGRLGAESADAGLEGVGNAYVRFAAAHPQLYRLMFGPATEKSRHPELLAAGEGSLGVLLAAVGACQAKGLLIDADTRELALSGWALCHGLASLNADGALDAVLPVDVHSTAARLIGWLMRGLLRSTPRARAH